MSCNNFGVSINNKESDSSLISSFFTSQLEKKISDLKSEIDSKYLDETEADLFYINDPISENIDLRGRKIINSGEPKDFGDLVNKKYVDNQFIQNESLDELTYAKKSDIPKNIAPYPFQNTKVGEALTYYNIALTYKPKVWISAKFPFGLFKLKSTYTLFSDIMGNKVIQGLITVNPENNAIYAENIAFANSTYSLNLLETKLSRITINTEFLIDYTFIFVARKVHEDDFGSIFTSTKPNRIFGWRNDGKTFKVGQGEATVGTYNEDTDLHYYIVVCTMNKIQFWDLDSKIGNTSVIENYGNVVIGKALESKDTNDK